MKAQAIIINDDKLLMVHQLTNSGKTIWNFPGGGVEEGETPEEATIREVKEETGYEISNLRSIYIKPETKYTYTADITGGNLDKKTCIEWNDDILDIEWVSLTDKSKIDKKVEEMLERFYEVIKNHP